MTITDSTRPSARARYSVTGREGISYKVGSAGRFRLTGGWGYGIAQPLPKWLPSAPRNRDRILYTTPRAESQWGSVLGIAVTKLAAWSWNVLSSTESRKRVLQYMLLTSDFGHPSGLWGWVPFIQRLGRDFLTTNNGSFYQIGRVSRAYGSRLTGLFHLSSLRCRRTGDPDYPVIYTDRLGRENVLRWFEVVSMTDCPEPDDIGNGYGFCSADRAYDQIKALAALEGYHYEKVTGNSPTAIHLINGLSQPQLDDILADVKDEQAESGATQYMGAIIATLLKPDAIPAVATIQLAGLPDNADPNDVRARADLVYANALGMDLNEIRPQGGQALGVGAQTQVMHQKAKGKGVVSFRQQFNHGMNWQVCDPRSRFYFTERDLVDDERRARIAATHGTAVDKFIKAGTLSPRQGQEYLIENEIVPRRFARRDLKGDPLSDDEKPKLRDIEDQNTPGAAQPVDEFVDPTKRQAGQAGQFGNHQAPGPGAGLGDSTPSSPSPELIDRTSASRTESEQNLQPAIK